MSFLNPAFLFALAAVVVPVIIHLFNFRKFKRVYFSNVTFLKDVEQKAGSGRKLKNLLILAVRVLAIVFLVLAFARPNIPAKGTVSPSERLIVSIYIDNSFSMEAVNKEGTLLDEAKRHAREIASSYSLNTKFQLLTNDFYGRQRLLAYEEFLDELDDIKISPAVKTLPQIIGWQHETFSEDPGAVKQVYLISDFQKNMLKRPIETDSGTAIHLIRLQANAQPNLSIDSVWFASPVHQPGILEKLMVRIKNNSDEDAVNIPIKLLINKQQKAIGTISLEARKSGIDTLSFSGLNGSWQQGEVQLTDYPLIFDDRFYFSFPIRHELNVLAINQQRPNAYLEAAYRAESFFKLQQVRVGNVNYSQLSSFPLVILDNAEDIGEGLASQLQEYVKNGGTLMVFPALAPNLLPLKKLLSGLRTDIPEQIVNNKTRVGRINLQHPLFKDVFENIPKNIDLPIAEKFIQFSRQSKVSRQPILELPGGRGFLSQYNFGKGEVYLSSVPLNEKASNLVQHAVFLPIMYRAAFLSLDGSRLFYTIGKDEILETNKISLSPNQTLKLKKDDFETIPDLRQAESGSRLFTADQIKEDGIYQLHKADSLLGLFAFNNDRSESDLTYASESALKAQFPNQKTVFVNPQTESLQKAIKTAPSGTQLWKLCLILALLCLAAEILLIRFFTASEYKFQHSK